MDVALFMPWLSVFASAESDWGSRGAAPCARVPQEHLGALLLLSFKFCFSGRVDLEEADHLQVRKNLTRAISLVDS